MTPDDFDAIWHEWLPKISAWAASWGIQEPALTRVAAKVHNEYVLLLGEALITGDKSQTEPIRKVLRSIAARLTLNSGLCQKLWEKSLPIVRGEQPNLSEDELKGVISEVIEKLRDQMEISNDPPERLLRTRLIRKGIDAFRQKKTREKRYHALDEGYLKNIISPESSFEPEPDPELISAVIKLTHRLRPRDQELVRLPAGKTTWDTIADSEETKTTPEAVRKRHERAIKRLRDWMNIKNPRHGQ